MTEIFKQNPMLIVMGALVLGGLLVCSLLGLFMARSDASLRPISFFAIAFGLVVLPQAVAHLAMAVKPGTVKPPSADAAADFASILGLPVFTIAVRDGMVADPDQVFGPSMPGARLEDSRDRFINRMPGLQVANTASLPTGETIAALVFGTEAQATDGLLAYLGLYEVAVELDRGGAEVKGKRGLGQDRMHLLRSGNAVLIGTALTEEMLRARMAAIPMLRTERAATATATASAGEPLVPALQPLVRLFEPTWAKVVGTVLMVLVVSIWFFKGSIWASSVPAEPGMPTLAESALRDRVLAVNGTDVPVAVEELNDGRIAITWRYADARWTDLMNTHRMLRTHRLLMRFDAHDRAVRVTEQWTMFDASAGANGARLSWKTALGITLFQVDHRKVYGLKFGPDGRPTGNLSYTYRFNLQELKAPIIAAITQAGWNWKPVLIDVPPALRWATE